MIRCHDLTKRYPLGGREKYRNLRDIIVDRVKNPFARRNMTTFTALDGFTAEFKAGEVTGLVGKNGAGKSTLLKILSRVTRPTGGSAEIDGRVGSLLEVGTGFHPELTGRENIYFNGAILGMRKREIDRRFDEIVAFANVEQFLDTPVKRYSSGMYVRLAFAVGAHLDTDVLLVDEVLAVGDAEFQKKCLGKMRDVTEEGGRTILFVSHNLNAVQRLCPRSVLIENGKVVNDGPTNDIVAQYLSGTHETLPGEWVDLTSAQRRGNGQARFKAMRVLSQPYSNESLDLEVQIESNEERSVPSLSATIADRYGTKLVNCDSISSGERMSLKKGLNHLHLHVKELHLNAGLYVVNLWLAFARNDPFDAVEGALTFEVADRPQVSLGAKPARDGCVTSDYLWSVA
jgi:ABC-type polysaccharide/polyol phosphate transport system ATPase subunit